MNRIDHKTYGVRFVECEEVKPLKARRGKKEVLTDKDIEELMGINRGTYKRSRGAYRQR